jgi:hypothetical protein
MSNVERRVQNVEVGKISLNLSRRFGIAGTI